MSSSSSAGLRHHSDQDFSASVFDHLLTSVDRLKQQAAIRNDWVTYKEAVQVRSLLYRYKGSLIADRRILTRS
jgi:hypothetical protein